MLSDEDQRELKALANAAALREDCEMLRRASQRAARACSVDDYLAFLKMLNHMLTLKSPTGPLPVYTNVRH
jgi:hypothetical protein